MELRVGSAPGLTHLSLAGPGLTIPGLPWCCALCAAGTLFEAPPGAAPERDRRGELAFRAVSWTPWPVEEEAEGERLRLEVGTVGQLQKRTFVFEKVRRGVGGRAQQSRGGRWGRERMAGSQGKPLLPRVHSTCMTGALSRLPTAPPNSTA